MAGEHGAAMRDPIEYDFNERMAFSDGNMPQATVETVCMTQIPDAVSVERASTRNDRHGVDWWVYRKHSAALAIDAKVREEDWAAKPHPLTADDLALETWSVVEKEVVGWTRDTSKQTDYILWIWVDTGRWCLVSFPMLCAVMQDNWKQWLSSYKNSRQSTTREYGTYHSECVFVPRREVWRQIYLKFSGVPAT